MGKLIRKVVLNISVQVKLNPKDVTGLISAYTTHNSHADVGHD
jgi:hypothetical protein